MAESYSVEAILSAQDKGFSSLFGKAESLIGGVDKGAGKVKGFTGSLIGANLAATAIGKGVSIVTSGVGSMVGELNDSSKAWKTFEGNMSMIGKSQSEIKAVKSSLQDYATQTIYSASDMASTFSQMAAIGYKDSEKLVKGMGGLAASAENPQQAMKSLSQQMVQALAKPNLAWQDFRIMMERAPAGMAAVAKEMGYSLDDFVLAIQDGKIKSEDFAEAVGKVGTNAEFSKMATEFKTIDQAIDGARETLANKLMPTFEILTDVGIGAVTGIADAFEGMNFDGLNTAIMDIVSGFEAFGMSFDMADGVSHLTQLFKTLGDIAGQVFQGIGVNTANLGRVLADAIGWVNQFMMSFKMSGAAQKFNEAIRAIGEAVSHVFLSLFGDAESNASDLGATVGKMAGQFADFVKGIADFVKELDPGTIKAVASAFAALGTAIVGIKIGKKVAGIMSMFNVFKKNPLETLASGASKSGGIIGKIFAGIGRVAKDLGTGIATAFKGLGTGLKSALTGLGKAFEGLGKGISKISPGQMLSLAVAIVAVGVSTYIAAMGFSLMADAAIRLGEAGLGAQVMFVAMLAGLGALIALFGVFGNALTANAIGMLAFGATFLLISAGIALIATQGEGLKAVFEGIGNAIGTMVTAIAGGMATVIGAIASGASQIITAFTPIAQIISDTIIGVTEAIAPFIPAITEMVSSVVAQLPKIIAAFSGLVGEVGGAISQIIAAVSDLVAQIGPILESAGQMFKDMGTGIKTALDGVSGVVEKVGEAVNKALGGIEGIITAVGDSAEKMGNGFKTFSEGLIAIGNADLDLAGIGVGLGLVGGGVKDIANAGIETVSSGMQGISQALASTFRVSALAEDFRALGESLGGFPDISSIGQQLGTLGSSLATIFGVSALAGDFTALGTALGSIFRVSALAGDFTALGSALSGFPNVSSVGTGLSSIGSSLKNIYGVSALAGDFTALGASITSMSATSVAAFAIMVLATTTAMTQITMQITNGMNRSTEAFRAGLSRMQQTASSGFRAIISSAQSFKTSFIQVFATLPSQMQTIGVNIGQGLNRGLASQRGAIMTTANGIANDITRTIKSALDVHSPSRVAIWITEMFGAGLVKGLLNSVGIVKRAASYVSDVIPQTIGSPNIDVNANGRLTAFNDGQVNGYPNLEDKFDRLIDVTEKGKSLFIDKDKLVGATGQAYDNYFGENRQVGGRRQLA